jgi:hypothetical protein
VKSLILFMLLAMMALQGCNEEQSVDLNKLSPKEREAVSHLTWLREADAARDAEDAIRRGDLRLLAMATRNPVPPGIAPGSVAEAKAKCDLRYVEGSTDMVAGKVHLKFLQAAQKYAEQYNRVMLKSCLR